MLLLKRHLVDLVRAGKKRQTIRLWTHAHLRKGQISYTPGLGKMKITAIDKLPSLDALTEADAIADGFATLSALIAEIHKIYGKTLPANRHVYRIRFSWPIDAAGRTLIVNPREDIRTRSRAEKTQITKHKPQNHSVRSAASSAPTPRSAPRPRKSHMTPHQRQTLRSYILAQSPGASHHKQVRP